MSFCFTGVLLPSEIKPILDETSFFFKNAKFHPSAIASSKKPVDDTIRSSTGMFATAHPHRINETVGIALELIGQHFGNKIQCHKFPQVQLLSYKKGDFYAWHVDYLHSKDGFHRALSISINLNDDYTGGGIEVKDRDKLIVAPNVVGGFALFTSLHSHRAIAVESGERKAITFWFETEEKDFINMQRDYKHYMGIK